jgi:hypothetical protein
MAGLIAHEGMEADLVFYACRIFSGTVLQLMPPDATKSAHLIYDFCVMDNPSIETSPANKRLCKATLEASF